MNWRQPSKLSRRRAQNKEKGGSPLCKSLLMLLKGWLGKFTEEKSIYSD